MNKIIHIFILLLITTACVYSQGRGNGGGQSLDQLNNQIRSTRELLKSFSNEQAELLVKSAESLRDEAVTLYAANRNQLGNVKVKAAFALLNKAVDMLSEVPVERILEQVDDLIRNAENLLSGKNDKNAERLLNQARSSRTKATQEYRGKNARKAMEHVRIARFYAERCISIVQGPGVNSEASLDNEKNRYEELYQQAEESIANCENEQAKKLLQQVRDQYINIDKAKERGNSKLLLNMYYNNTRLLLRAMDLCQGKNQSLQEQAIEDTESLGELLNTVKDQSDFTTTAKSRVIIQRAERLHQQAEEAVNVQNYELAIRRAYLGRNFLSRLWNDTPEKSLENKTSQELEQLKADIDRIRNNSSREINPRTSSLLRAAESCTMDAEQFLELGRIRLALESIYAGNRFLTSVESLTGNTSSVTRQEISKNLAQLEEKLQQYESDKESSEGNSELYGQAVKMQQNAKNALNSNQYDLAQEYIKLGLNILEKINN